MRGQYCRMSPLGYKRKFQPPPRHVRLSPNSRHSSAEVRYRADFVRFTPESRRGSGRSRESEVDPLRTFGLFEAPAQSRHSGLSWERRSIARLPT